MKKIIFITVICIISAINANQLPVGIELGTGYTIQDGNDPLLFEGSALVNVYKNFYLRTELANITFVSDETYMSIGTGQGIVGLVMIPSYGVDLMMFSYAPTFAPYGLGGFNITSGGGHSYFSIKLGAGSEFEISKSFKPFAEVALNVYKNGDTQTAITLKGGIRIR
jgi:hypothetical protein